MLLYQSIEIYSDSELKTVDESWKKFEPRIKIIDKI